MDKANLSYNLSSRIEFLPFNFNPETFTLHRTKCTFHTLKISIMFVQNDRINYIQDKFN